MSDSELNEMMKNVKKKAFGWSIYSKIKNYEVIYEAGTIFLALIIHHKKLISTTILHRRLNNNLVLIFLARLQ